jgi:hypothetical protein
VGGSIGVERTVAMIDYRLVYLSLLNRVG